MRSRSLVKSCVRSASTCRQRGAVKREMGCCGVTAMLVQETWVGKRMESATAARQRRHIVSSQAGQLANRARGQRHLVDALDGGKELRRIR